MPSVTCLILAGLLALGTGVSPAFAAEPIPSSAAPLGIPVEFLLFAAVLVGVAFFHRHTLRVAVTGLAVIVAYKLLVTGFKYGTGTAGLIAHIASEWVILTNLFMLLIGFGLLSRHFVKTRIPAVLPRFLPHDWKGAFWLLVVVFVLSSFLDNIAAALIGGAMAHTLFRARVHIGYLAALVAASNAGGSGSVIGDTTTTMMWIDGVSPREVVHAYVAAGTALLIFGVPAARQQQRYSPILKHEHTHVQIDWVRVGIVGFILATAIVTNVVMNVRFPAWADSFPFIGLSVVLALLVSTLWRRPDWEIVPESARGCIFLLSLVFSATLMPVERLPGASWQTALGLGFISAIFDNIPLTALALRQGGYDWGMLAYTVGFGGSMVWFGSSAGVAISNLYPDAKSAALWLRHGWHVIIAYVVGFIALLTVLGWNPNAAQKVSLAPPVVPTLPLWGSSLTEHPNLSAFHEGQSQSTRVVLMGPCNDLIPRAAGTLRQAGL
jgi:Na+/H+ antiporter NhaD/arsenite permease-like protein